MPETTNVLQSPHDIIRMALMSVCHDGRANAGDAARAVINALRLCGYQIVRTPNA
jgi:hypothetical protein